jgi:hypothetical protein
VRAVGDYGRMDPKMRKHSLQIDRAVFQLRPGGGLRGKWDLCVKTSIQPVPSF